MFIEIKVPDIGKNEVEVTEILVKVGELINIDQSLITVEDEKALIEIPSPETGIVKEIKVSVGDKISTGKLIMIFDKAEAIKNISSEKKIDFDFFDDNKKNLSNSELKNVFMPDIGNKTFTVKYVMVNIGDVISMQQSIIIVKNHNTLMEISAPFSGEVYEIKITEGDTVTTGSLIMVFKIKGTFFDVKHKNNNDSKNLKSRSFVLDSISSSQKIDFTFPNENTLINNKNYVYASPFIRRLARKFGVQLTNIKGTGRKGRILYEDIQNYIKETMEGLDVKKFSEQKTFNIKPWPKIDFSKFGVVEEVEFTRIQKISNANLSRNWVMIPHVTIMEDADITDMDGFRRKKNKEIENLSIKITPLVFVMKAVACTLKEMPRFNSSISEDGKRLILKKYIHIGIAVDTLNGLVVPVIRDVNKKGIIELSKELIEISDKARKNHLNHDDMQGGSFTISSLGAIGTKSFTPIVNAPEVAIIGLSRAYMKPIWNGSAFIARLILPMSLSFDHRVLDGADGVRFINRISQLISDIRLLIM
ncbi:2-oxo acid dehydrogenase subunit E2 [Arsenophonus symbiont of Ornithomya chloropus]|uniref:2-oxo acid dehydrogenase subunit E2 n=1 Tax=Arsenophonus symbiont of Ornithomya chloropus TaxID=634121 RepID=UPI0032B15076